jgi:hypothetical protein
LSRNLWRITHLSLPQGSCEKIQLPGEINFSRCPGDGKIRAAKIGGTGMIPNGYLVFREETPATWNKTM